MTEIDGFSLGKLTEIDGFSLGKLTRMEKKRIIFLMSGKMLCVSILLIVNSFRETADGRATNSGRLFGAGYYELLLSLQE